MKPEPDADTLRAAQKRLLAAKQAVDDVVEEDRAARAELGAAILAAREAGMTVPDVVEFIGYSEANVFRVSAQAKKAAAGK